MEREGKGQDHRQEAGLLPGAASQLCCTSCLHHEHTRVRAHTHTLAHEKGWSGFPSCRQDRAH